MKIQKITSQHRRDFEAIYECEQCGHTLQGQGYDDDNFHVNVIPAMVCPECLAGADPDYRPLSTKYEAHIVI